MTNDPNNRYRCASCLHKHYWTQGHQITIQDKKRVLGQATNFGSWGMCEDPDCMCIAMQRLTANQLEKLLDKAEELLDRPIGHRPPGVEIPTDVQPVSNDSGDKVTVSEA